MGGSEGANCGRTKYGFERCTQLNRKCGILFCSGGDEYPITGLKAFYSMPNGEKCNKAVDQDKIRSLDMVPTGTKCGMNMVCYDHKCQDVKVFGQTSDCSSKCHNNGVCNNKGQCHCNPGWAPPYCDITYSDLPREKFGIMAGVSAAVVVLFLLTILVAGLMCCKKDKRENYTSKRKVHSTSGQLNPMFRERDQKSREISQPTFMETSAKQACTPLFVTVVPSRPPPQPPMDFPAASRGSRTEPSKRLPPTKPLPTVNCKPKTTPVVQVPPAKPSPPPVPPVKPTASKPVVQMPPAKPSPPPVPQVKPTASKTLGTGHKTALKPPPMPRR